MDGGGEEAELEIREVLIRLLAIAVCLSCLSCGDGEPQPKTANAARQEPPPPAKPRDSTFVEKKPFTDVSAQDAAKVLQTYYALIEAGRYEEALELRWERRTGKEDAEAFAAGFGRYSEYHATVGAPGPVSGADGLLYVDVPVQVYGRLKSGAPFSTAGTITLRRTNRSPNAGWRIYSRE
ncbi:MAG TPA: hypothetical protein VNT77_03910 [Allosphingosinicella sp.]|nr:hypothetical protein [Allosphingosinicella sp.]